MIIHDEELALAQAYASCSQFIYLTKSQIQMMARSGAALLSWFKKHIYLHYAISAGVIVLLLSADLAVLLVGPSLFVSRGGHNAVGSIVLAGLLVGMSHSLIVYSLVVYSLHEGAAHDLIFPATGPVSRFLGGVARNLCRLGAADPIHYGSHHLSHHAKFGTPEDGEFLSFVLSKRYWLTLLPFAMFLNLSDFVVHRPIHYGRSQFVSLGVALLYNFSLGVLIARQYGVALAVLTLLVFTPHVGFYVDRLRQFTEHNLMPLDGTNGARSFGVGFWGLLIGGGPWGQPCHLIHHIVPRMPWYGQITLHFRLKASLTEAQKQQFLIPPLIGFPLLLWRLWREPRAFARGVQP